MKRYLLTGVTAFAVFTAVPAWGGGEIVERQAHLDGDHPAASSPDRNGTARVSVNLNREGAEICYRVAFEDITVRGVYVYRNGIKTDGRFAAVKLYDEAPTDSSPIRGCVQDVERALIRRLKQEPKRFYVEAFEYDGNNITGTLKR